MAPSLGRGCWRLKTASFWRRAEVFEHQTAARPKPAKHGSEPEPKQVKHGNQVIADPLADCPAKLLISKPDRIVTRECVQGRLTCSVGGKSHRGNSQGPVAWVAFVEETKRMKPTDKAILGMVSESPGRNASKPISGPETQ